MKVSRNLVEDEKASFVTHELANLLSKVNASIYAVEYILSSETRQEYVKVHYSNRQMSGAVSVCITDDSLGTLTADVLKGSHSREL